MNAQPAADACVDAEPCPVSDRPRILIVDDSPVDCKMAAMLLSRGLCVEIEHAEHGLAALDMMGRRQPDLVLTDLHMPEMDGLALVEAIRSQFPLVPTILMTALGSEDIAMQALRRGAASYVAKRRLSSDLVNTVRDVLAVSQQDLQERRLHECWGHTEFEFHLASDVTLVPVLVSHLQRYLRSLRHCDETELVRVGVALTEALQNAVFHGNLELDSELRRRGGATSTSARPKTAAGRSPIAGVACGFSRANRATKRGTSSTTKARDSTSHGPSRTTPPIRRT